MERFIQVKDIPHSIWSGSEQLLSLPEPLIDSWVSLLKQNDLEAIALQKAPEGFIGGMNKADTDKHFAWRYTGSCGRVILTALDPKSHLSEVSDAYATIFAANKVLLADLPCGSGAGSVSIIATLIELRKHNVLPRLPLTIKILAAEISQYALVYYVEQLEKLKVMAFEQAIEVEYETVHWDALDKVSTADLIRKLTLLNQDCNSRLLLLTNFSGFLDKNQKWEKAEPQFEQIFIHSRDKSSTAIWIEPGSKNIDGFFNKLTYWFNNKFLTLLKISIPNIDSLYGKSSSKCKHPLKDHLFNISLTVKRFQLPAKDL